MIKEPIRAIKIFKSQVKNRSLSEILFFLISALFKVESILIYTKELDNRIPSQANYNFNDHITKGDLHELEMIRKSMLSPPWEFSCHLYDGVKDFFIFKDNGIIGHISWVYYKNDPNRIINLSPDEGEIKYSLTLEPYRGRGIYPATLKKIQEYLKNKGLKRVFICVNKGNYPSIKGIQKAGFELVTRIKLMKFMGIQLNRKFSNL